MSKLIEDLLAEGEAKGKVKQLVELVQQGLLQITDAAKVSGMSIDEFKKMI